MSKLSKRLKNRKTAAQKQGNAFREILTDIQKGGNLPTLIAKHSPKQLKRTFTLLAENEPEFLTKIFGPPASTYRILIDECLDTGLVQTVHQNIGEPHTVSQMLEKSIKDHALYPQAQEKKIRAIITCDAVGSGTPDICGIAQNAFKTGDPNAPHIIIVSQGITASTKEIEKNAALITSALKENPDILDLRT